MTSIVACRADEYLRYAEECWKFVENTNDPETKAVFELTAEAWTMLATQVETLAGAHSLEAISEPAHLESAA
jgi:hypothetical protein